MTEDEGTEANEPLIELDNVTLRVGDRHLLPGSSWTVRAGEHWAVIGPNGTGKTTLLRALSGDTPVVSGKIKRNPRKPPQVEYFGPELHRSYLQDETRRELLWSPISSNYPASTVDDFLGTDASAAAISYDFFEKLNLEKLRKRVIRTLSNGEMRKVLLARAINRFPDILLLDEPFDGLDESARSWLSDAAGNFQDLGITLIIAAHRKDEILPLISSALVLNNQKIERCGSLSDHQFRDTINAQFAKNHRSRSASPKRTTVSLVPGGKPLVEFKDVTVRYNGTPVFDGLNWTMRKGENWCVAGPNGSGKTTILNLIVGDNLQGYSNDVRLFGRRRGSGESIWDLKRHIGYVTPHLLIRYDKQIPVRDVILSGFFDSIGLYRWTSPAQIERYEELIHTFDLSDLAGRRFDRLSSGERMIVLIARAVIKEPELLILDEPCQGLDSETRDKVLDAVDAAETDPGTNIIFVTHRNNEIPTCINRQLTLDPGEVKSASPAIHSRAPN
ncbi:MAG: ATP-binding cassette domain-containing protein [Spirochaetales bacterium]|jgi:molybdate transport system ATP-binding protein|nr:ATP-binding cassette domain-containing protein [Spirochaetales bacterium]